MELTEAKAAVAAIDREWDAILNAVMFRLHHAPHTVREWQNAWDRCPDLHARHRQISLRRHAAQETVYAVETKIARREERAQRAKHQRERRECMARPFVKCPCCGTWTRDVLTSPNHP